jgi:two-component system, OmpR family, copper resistance phosphate regulon response regulator CusR
MDVREIETLEVLVVEDDRKLASALKEGLEADHYSVRVAHTGDDGLSLVLDERFALIILDVMLPGRDGLEILQILRGRDLNTPVLLLTARDRVEDRVRGLDSGADDYLVKPFAFPELLARMRVLLRRGNPDGQTKMRLADLEMDVLNRSVVRGGRKLALTVREFELLQYLFRHQGRIVSREMLSRDVWKETARHTPLDNVIDVHIAHLRRKVDDQYNRKLVHTVRGVGFILREESSP